MNYSLIYLRISYGKAAKLFQSAVDLAQLTQSSQKAWATAYLNLGTCHRKLKFVLFGQPPFCRVFTFLLLLHRGFEEARMAYLKVLELDPRNAVALGFLGIVCHLLGELDKAIVKYHEVSATALTYLGLSY